MPRNTFLERKRVPGLRPIEAWGKEHWKVPLRWKEWALDVLSMPNKEKMKMMIQIVFTAVTVRCWKGYDEYIRSIIKDDNLQQGKVLKLNYRLPWKGQTLK